MLQRSELKSQKSHTHTMENALGLISLKVLLSLFVKFLFRNSKKKIEIFKIWRELWKHPYAWPWLDSCLLILAWLVLALNLLAWSPTPLHPAQILDSLWSSFDIYSLIQNDTSTEMDTWNRPLPGKQTGTLLMHALLIEASLHHPNRIKTMRVSTKSQKHLGWILSLM